MTEDDDAPDAPIPDAPDALADAYNRALALEKSGALDAAADAYREVLRLDPADHGGAAVRLAAMGRGAPPAQAPEAYVATLFDQTAEMFEAILVDQLSYDAPWLLRDRLDALAPGPYARMLDLGCGTGLAGEALADICAAMEGVDLSAGMLEIAADRGIYDELYLGEAAAFLHAPSEDGSTPPLWDLIVATDVLPYLGDAGPLLSGARAAAAPNAVLALTTETPPDAAGDAPWIVGANQRYAHSEAYVRAALDAAGFEPFHAESFVVRTNQGAPEPGQLFLARRRA